MLSKFARFAFTWLGRTRSMLRSQMVGAHTGAGWGHDPLGLRRGEHGTGRDPAAFALSLPLQSAPLWAGCQGLSHCRDLSTTCHLLLEYFLFLPPPASCLLWHKMCRFRSRQQGWGCGVGPRSGVPIHQPTQGPLRHWRSSGTTLGSTALSRWVSTAPGTIASSQNPLCPLSPSTETGAERGRALLLAPQSLALSRAR